MSIHPSLTISEKDKKTRSVLKRIERIRQMQEKGNWKQGDSVYGLPKIKSMRIKIKKEKGIKQENRINNDIIRSNDAVVFLLLCRAQQALQEEALEAIAPLAH